MSSLKQEKLGDITVDNSVKYISQNEKDSEPHTIKNNSLPREQDKNLSQINKKMIKSITAEGFGTLT